MDPAIVMIAIASGLLIGFSMGTVGGGGAIMAVPALVYGMHQSPIQATTASLVIVLVTAIHGGVASMRRGVARLSEGLAFGCSAVIGAIIGATISHRLSARLLMTGFVLVLLATVAANVRKLVRERRGHLTVDDPQPIFTRHPFAVRWPLLAKFVTVASVVGLLTGLLGVGGGFMIVPALTLVLGLSIHRAAGTSLVVMMVTSLAALATRLVEGGLQHAPSWPPVAVMTGCALIGSVIGGRVAHRAQPRTLGLGFTVLISVIAIYSLAKLLPSYLSHTG